MLFFLCCMLGCQEDKNDFTFFVSSGSNEEPEVVEEQIEPATEPEDVPIAEPEMTQEPSSTQDDCALPVESYDLPPQDLQGRVDCGEEVYITACANCHGAQGQGTPNGQGLVGHIQGHSDIELIQSIVYGEGSMPPINLENQEVADVIAYMREDF